MSAVEQLKLALRMSPTDGPNLDYDENATIAPAELSTAFGISVPGSVDAGFDTGGVQ